MKNLETNKIAAAIFLAGLLALLSGKIADGLYHPVEDPDQRGYQVEVAAEGDTGATEKEEEEPIDIAALMEAASADSGSKVFKKCAACHTIEQGGPHRVGPNLAGVVGADKGHHNDYSYSDALKAKGGKWTEEDLFHFLHKPKDYLPGTKMTFAGIKKPEQIADLIEFLKNN